MNRQTKRNYQKVVTAKLVEIQKIQATLKRPTTIKNYDIQMKRVKQLFDELEQMGVMRKKSKIEKITDAISEFIRKFKIPVIA